MNKLFNALLLILITSVNLKAQEFSKIEMDEIHTIYDESFTTDANTVLVLNIKNTTAQVLKSPDDKVHIKYTMEFKNYRRKSVEANLKRLKVSGKKENNKITYSSIGRNLFYYRYHDLEEVLVGRLKVDDSISESEKHMKQKSLDSVLKEINNSGYPYRSVNGSLKITPRIRKWKKSDKICISRMVIQIPEHTQIRANFESSELVFNDDFTNKITMNSQNSKLKFKTLTNAFNNLDIDDGRFLAEQLIGGNFKFTNSRRVEIGRLENTKINSEFTNIELGEISKGNTITDFNSELLFHNFSKNFEHFNLESQYSKINLFLPEDNFSLTTFGFNTVHYTNDIKTEIRPSKDQKKSKMMVYKPKAEEAISGEIHIDTVHGIIRLGEDNTIKLNN